MMNLTAMTDRPKYMGDLRVKEVQARMLVIGNLVVMKNHHDIDTPSGWHLAKVTDLAMERTEDEWLSDKLIVKVQPFGWGETEFTLVGAATTIVDTLV